MLKYLSVFLLVGLPVFLKAQPPTLARLKPTSSEIMKNDCDGKIFTRVQHLPFLKISNAKFEDTLTSILKSNGAFHKTDRVIFKFIITSKSQMIDLIRENGEIQNENIVKASLKSFSNLWLPAIQNGETVCSYVRLEMTILDDKLSIKIAQ